jgi:DNA-binding NarL/FixJ family response regulator
MKTPEPIFLFLINEDESFRENLIQVFREGMQEYVHVKSFNCPEECFKSLNLRPDFIVYDYDQNISRIGDLLHLLKPLSSGTRLIVLSAEERMDLAVEAIKSGAFDCLLKDEESISKIKSLVRDHSLLLNTETNLPGGAIQNPPVRLIRKQISRGSYTPVFFLPFIIYQSGSRNYIYPKRKNNRTKYTLASLH